MLEQIKLLIVEDELIIGETIKLYLEERGHETIDIVVSYEDALDSLIQNQNSLPDVVLIDVRLYGEKSGIDLAYFLNDNYPDLPYIFLTSQYDKRIVENAMKTSPSGYLAKPIPKETLWTTVELAYNNRVTSSPSLEIYDGKKTHILKQNEILYFEADHVYIKIYQKNNEFIMTRRSLQHFSELVDNQLFVKCHRGYIVNLSFVDSFDKNELKIGVKTIPISRSKRNDVFDRLQSVNS